MTSLSDHTLSWGECARDLAGPMGMEERWRDLQAVELVMLDGTEVRGVLQSADGTGTLDYLNCRTEAFVALTDATLTRAERTEQVSFIAINKAHIVRVIEAAAAG